jgi:single-strand DNA-binding protein
MFNKIIIAGNLTQAVDLKYSTAGLAIAKSAVATNRKFKTQNGEQKEETMFIDIILFGRSAEVAQQYLRKGSKLLIEGRLQFEQWQDNNNQKRSKHSVIVESMQMLDSKADQQTSTPQMQQQHPIKQYQPVAIPEIDLDEEIPF